MDNNDNGEIDSLKHALWKRCKSFIEVNTIRDTGDLKYSANDFFLVYDFLYEIANIIGFYSNEKKDSEDEG